MDLDLNDILNPGPDNPSIAQMLGLPCPVCKYSLGLTVTHSAATWKHIVELSTEHRDAAS